MTDDFLKRHYPETPSVQVDPEILGGTPCIRGTRLNVYAIAARLTGQETAEDIVAENPWVTVQMVHDAVEYARIHPQVEHPEGKPWRHLKPIKLRDVAQ